MVSIQNNSKGIPCASVYFNVNLCKSIVSTTLSALKEYIRSSQSSLEDTKVVFLASKMIMCNLDHENVSCFNFPRTQLVRILNHCFLWKILA